jgi:hypothetical protein
MCRSLDSVTSNEFPVLCHKAIIYFIVINFTQNATLSAIVFVHWHGAGWQMYKIIGNSLKKWH